MDRGIFSTPLLRGQEVKELCGLTVSKLRRKGTLMELSAKNVKKQSESIPPCGTEPLPGIDAVAEVTIKVKYESSFALVDVQQQETGFPDVLRELDVDFFEQSFETDGFHQPEFYLGSISEVFQINEEVDELDEGESSERLGSVLDVHTSKTSPEFVSEMLQDGSLSVHGLESKGFVLSDDEAEEVIDSSEEDESSSDSEEEEGNTKNKSKAKIGAKDVEDTEPPRTKHEVEALPPVPIVTAVLEPNHDTVSVGQIFSVLNLSVIVEATSDNKVLNENSILWLTESRVPLGIIDEVFGPVKKPFYVVRFNEVSEIPAAAKTGVEVSYVAEFSEFVIKDNPALYKKAVDASGFDDEELPSDEDNEFSDDEKEAEARLRERSKRALERQENGCSQHWSPAEGQPPHNKGQRRERNKGRGHGGWNGPATLYSVDSAADIVAGMDLQGSPQDSSRFTSNKQNGRSRNRGKLGRQRSLQNAGQQESLHRVSRTSPGNGFASSPLHREFPHTRDSPFALDQLNNQMMYPSVAAQRSHQAAPAPVNLGALRQQPVGVLQPFGYNNVPSYGANGASGGQGTFYTFSGGPPLVQNPVLLSSPSQYHNPHFNNQWQNPVNNVYNLGHNVHAAQMNHGLSQMSGSRQAGGYPTHSGYIIGSAPMFGGAVIIPDHRYQSNPQISQDIGAVDERRVSHDGRGAAHGHQRSFLNTRGSQGR